jgi:hypothetical protein
MVIVLASTMHEEVLHPIGIPVWGTVVTIISHRTLFALAAEVPLPDHYQEGPDHSAPDGAGGGEGEGKGTVEEKQEMVVPWEEWGPQAARVLKLSSHPWMTAHAGQRLLSFESDKLVIRDFSAARIRCARARSRSHHRRVSPHTCEDSVEQEDEDAATVGETIIPGGLGSCFKDDVVSTLPFLETHVDVQEGARDLILTDGKRLVILVRSVSRGSPFFHSKGALKDSVFTYADFRTWASL